LPDKVSTKINFGSEAFKKYLANTSWLFGEKLIRLLLAAFVQIFIIRYLGAEKFGLLSYAISITGLLAALTTFGLDSIVTRELVKTPEKRDYLLGTVFFLRLFGALLSFVLLYIILKLTGDNQQTIIIVFIVGASTLFQTFYVIEFYFHSKVQAKFSASVYLIALIITSAIKVFLIFIGAGLLDFAIVTSLEFMLTAAGFIVVYNRGDVSIFKWKFRKDLAASLLKDSWPLILSGVVVAIYMKIDQVLIKNMMDSKSLGYYSAAVRLCEAWYFIPLAISNSLFPAIINAKASSEEVYLSRLQKLYDIVAWIAISIAVPVTFLSGFIVTMFFGKEYLPAAPVLTIYIWAGVSVFLGVASSQYLIAENMTKLSFYRTFIGMVVNVILNIILIPAWGITGSAFATLVSYSTAVFAIGISRKSYKQFFMMVKSVFFINLFLYIIKYFTKRIKY
jgi:O-antigen/teichoic acid export membrane protein